jgi:hypothetical protein
MEVLMRTATIAILIALLCPHAWSAPKEFGTTQEQLASLELPAPHVVKVAVLPFWDYDADGSRQHVITAAVFEWIEHEGFDMVPLSKSVATLQGDRAVDPSVPRDGSVATRIGAELGADWVVFGDIEEYSFETQRQSLLGNQTVLAIRARLSVADCKKGEPLYWKDRKEVFDNLSFDPESKRLRIAIQGLGRDMLRPIFTVLPKHNTVGAVPNDKTLLKLIKSIWPHELE